MEHAADQGGELLLHLFLQGFVLAGDAQFRNGPEHHFQGTGFWGLQAVNTTVDVTVLDQPSRECCSARIECGVHTRFATVFEDRLQLSVVVGRLANDGGAPVERLRTGLLSIGCCGSGGRLRSGLSGLIKQRTFVFRPLLWCVVGQAHRARLDGWGDQLGQ